VGGKKPKETGSWQYAEDDGYTVFIKDLDLVSWWKLTIEATKEIKEDKEDEEKEDEFPYHRCHLRIYRRV